MKGSSPSLNQSHDGQSLYTSEADLGFFMGSWLIDWPYLLQRPTSSPQLRALKVWHPAVFHSSNRCGKPGAAGALSRCVASKARNRPSQERHSSSTATRAALLHRTTRPREAASNRHRTSRRPPKTSSKPLARSIARACMSNAAAFLSLCSREKLPASKLDTCTGSA